MLGRRAARDQVPLTSVAGSRATALAQPKTIQQPVPVAPTADVEHGAAAAPPPPRLLRLGVVQLRDSGAGGRGRRAETGGIGACSAKRQRWRARQCRPTAPAPAPVLGRSPPSCPPASWAARQAATCPATQSSCRGGEGSGRGGMEAGAQPAGRLRSTTRWAAGRRAPCNEAPLGTRAASKQPPCHSARSPQHILPQRLRIPRVGDHAAQARQAQLAAVVQLAPLLAPRLQPVAARAARRAVVGVRGAVALLPERLLAPDDAPVGLRVRGRQGVAQRSASCSRHGGWQQAEASAKPVQPAP